MSRRTDRTVYSPTMGGDRGEQALQDSRRTERTERGVDTVPRTQRDRPVQEPPPPRPDSPEPPSSSTIPQPGRTPNPDDPYPVPQGARSNRTNEYFVPREGIDREVVTADICRYLGNDALVRPGTYSNSQTRQVQEGYFITAYRNLTTEMIADLKADSQRWQTERRQTLESSRSTARNTDYLDSRTHQARQYYGPTTPAAAPGHPTSANNAGAQQTDYAYGAQYQYPAASNYAPAQVYSSDQAYASERDLPGTAQRGYYTGSTLTAPTQTGTRNDYYSTQEPVSPAQAGYGPRSDYYATQAPLPYTQGGYASQPRDRPVAYYADDAPASTQQGAYTSQQPVDSFRNRSEYDNPSSTTYGNLYQDSTPYAQVPAAAASNTAATSEPSRRHRDRVERDRHGQRRRQ